MCVLVIIGKGGIVCDVVSRNFERSSDEVHCMIGHSEFTNLQKMMGDYVCFAWDVDFFFRLAR